MKLVTGYRGFIGKRLYLRLREMNEDVLGIDLPAPKETELEKLLKEHDITGVYHCGAVTDTSRIDSELFYLNYAFTKQLVDIVDKSITIVYSSSAACYGNDVWPLNIYGWSKLAAEQYGLVNHPRFISLRYFNVYGPGEEHKGKMASVAYQAWKNNKYFKLFPGYPRRDFVYVDDVVNANLFAMANLNFSKTHYDVGSGACRTFEDFLMLMGCSYEYHSASEIPAWYQAFTVADANKFLPGWKPEFSLERGTSQYVEYLNATNN